MAPDFAWYRDEWGGRLPEDVFLECAPRAASRVRHLVGFNPVNTPAREAAFKRAVCAWAEAWAESGDGGGFTIGKYSRAASAETGAAAADAAARGELLHAGLLWGGVA